MLGVVGALSVDLLFFSEIQSGISYGRGKEGDGILRVQIDSLTPRYQMGRIFVQVVEVVNHHAIMDVRATSIVNTGVVILNNF